MSTGSPEAKARFKDIMAREKELMAQYSQEYTGTMSETY